MSESLHNWPFNIRVGGLIILFRNENATVIAMRGRLDQVSNIVINSKYNTSERL